MSTRNDQHMNVFEILSQKGLDYLIGIDFGHGETTATYYDIHCNQGTPDATQYHELRFTNSGNEHKIISAYYTDVATDKPRLVLNPETDFSRENVEAYFKDKVSVMSQNGKCNVMQTFAKLVFEAIKDNNHFIHYDDGSSARNFALFIACPSTWNDAEALEYLKLIQDAGVPADWVITESDAAYYKWTDTHLSDNQNLLLIDIGSSTVDIVAKTSDGKVSLPGKKSGAQRVEELLLPNMGINSDVEQAINAYYEGKRFRPDIETSCKLYTRKAKEDFYSYNQVSLDVEVRGKQFNVSTCGTERLIDTLMDRATVNDIIAPYKAEIRQLFLDTMTQLGWTPNDPSNKVLLTGGASKMDFVKEYAKEVFGESSVAGNDIEPDFVVSQGVCIYAKKCMELAEVVLSMEETPIEGIYKVKKKWEHPQSYQWKTKYGIIRYNQIGSIDIIQKYVEVLPCDYVSIQFIENEINVILKKAVPSQYSINTGEYDLEEKTGLYNILSESIILPCNYHSIWKPDMNGYSVISKIDQHNSSGYIKFKTGELVIPFQYELPIFEKCNELGTYVLKKISTRKWGALDKDNNAKIPFQYEECFQQYSGDNYMNRVKRNGLFGYIDRDGNEFIQCKYIDALDGFVKIGGNLRTYVAKEEYSFPFGTKKVYYIIDENERQISDKFDAIGVLIANPQVCHGIKNGRKYQFDIITGKYYNY